MPTTARGRAPRESSPYLDSLTRPSALHVEKLPKDDHVPNHPMLCFVSTNLNIGIQLPSALIWQANLVLCAAGNSILLHHLLDRAFDGPSQP